ncbi:Re/Si-specific NAD(P)(+) transhydrogenase subunit alpha [Demequina zhanjiangensis]|uniref:proton-translocating NAD(P)(+) transhydrogenase n=1 Tax=Demequina zhanjiangensis TaxID=3051659 RepID=A0ABT8G1F3_9MICO|nr:Re/Si-specific NAD(P)(+) transhydrogenase subunit alpha [Demequina sp. SYSU T00b26]MDN4472952.1 Re/Si-specific NAD(P)(+) transhydrogenase subunit alpha [Demequina sp. SYSU T00b26]
MKIGVPAETRRGERLVAASPDSVAKLIKLGYEVVVQEGAGTAASFLDEQYLEAGATMVDAAEAWGADVVTCVNAPGAAQIKLLAKDATLISTMAPQSNEKLVASLAKKGVTALALDAVPRISRAQAIDVLSTMSNVAGYRAVIEAAESYGGMFTGQVTAAGKTKPATVFIIGAGVAGLAAIGAASSLGAQVRAFDVRPEVAEQIGSMGGEFVVAPEAQQEISADGYAKPLTEEQQAAAMDVYAREAANADVVITTALVRGSAPTTITAAMVESMKPGSVVVDLAASGGGNCELTVPGKTITTDNGVTIVGWTDLTSRMPRHTSTLLGTNIVHLMALLTPEKDGHLVLDLEDVVQRGMTVAHQGEIMWPPPPVSVSAAPASAAVAGPSEEELAEQARVAAEEEQRKTQRRNIMYGIGAVASLLLLSFADSATVQHLTVFALAVIVGFYVISNVKHSLHTPLMSQTNAISGIILVGALLQIGSADTLVSTLAFIAAAVASINIFGGFLVTYRMLGMFRKDA